MATIYPFPSTSKLWAASFGRSVTRYLCKIHLVALMLQNEHSQRKLMLLKGTVLKEGEKSDSSSTEANRRCIR